MVASLLILNGNLSLEEIVFNLSPSVRRVQENGITYLVAPATSIVPGVLAGSKGPLLYEPGHIQAAVPDWDGVPITVYHPSDPITGEPLQSGDLGVWERQGVGEVRKTTYNGKLQHELWFDENRTERIDPRVRNALLRGEPIELSTGLYTKNVPSPLGSSHKGRLYTAYARNHVPDHMAILPDQRGACSRQDGCGVLINRATENGYGERILRNADGTLTTNEPCKRGQTAARTGCTPAGKSKGAGKKAAVVSGPETGGVEDGAPTKVSTSIPPIPVKTDGKSTAQVQEEAKTAHEESGSKLLQAKAELERALKAHKEATKEHDKNTKALKAAKDAHEEYVKKGYGVKDEPSSPKIVASLPGVKILPKGIPLAPAESRVRTVGIMEKGGNTYVDSLAQQLKATGAVKADTPNSHIFESLKATAEGRSHPLEISRTDVASAMKGISESAGRMRPHELDKVLPHMDYKRPKLDSDGNLTPAGHFPKDAHKHMTSNEEWIPLTNSFAEWLLTNGNEDGEEEEGEEEDVENNNSSEDAVVNVVDLIENEEWGDPSLFNAGSSEGQPCRQGQSAARSGCIPKAKGAGKTVAGPSSSPALKAAATPNISPVKATPVAKPAGAAGGGPCKPGQSAARTGCTPKGKGKGTVGAAAKSSSAASPAKAVEVPAKPPSAPTPAPTTSQPATKPAEIGATSKPVRPAPEPLPKTEAWDWKKNPGGLTGTPRESQTQTSRAKPTSGPSAKDMSDKLNGFLDKAVAGAKPLSAANKKEFAEGIARISARMPPAVLASIHADLHEVKFCGSIKDVSSSYREELKAVGMSKDKVDKYAPESMIANGLCGVVAGKYVITTDNIGSSANAKTSSAGFKSGPPSEGTLAHEMTHVIDKGHAHSDSKEFQAAFGKEIKGNDRLSKYAGTKPSEGFAEFGRLLYGTNHPHDKIEKAFPGVSAYFKSKGLWPNKRTDNVSAILNMKNGKGPLLDELFSGRKQLPGAKDNHADLAFSKNEKPKEKKEPTDHTGPILSRLSRLGPETHKAVHKKLTDASDKGKISAEDAHRIIDEHLTGK